MKKTAKKLIKPKKKVKKVAKKKKSTNMDYRCRASLADFRGCFYEG